MTTWSFAFSFALGSVVGFTLSFHWHLKYFLFFFFFVWFWLGETQLESILMWTYLTHYKWITFPCAILKFWSVWINPLLHNSYPRGAVVFFNCNILEKGKNNHLTTLKNFQKQTESFVCSFRQWWVEGSRWETWADSQRDSFPWQPNAEPIWCCPGFYC